jgi:mannan endo-1,4-beta-mannosidase
VKTTHTRILVSALALGTLSASLAQPSQKDDAGFLHFITRKGNKLYDGEKPFRFVGANMPGIMLPYDFTLYLPERISLPTPWEQEDAFKTLDQMNLRVLRTWNLPIRGPKEAKKPWHYVLGPGEFNEEAFRCTDHMLALANKYKVRVIFALTAGSGDYLGGIGQYAGHRGRKREEFYTDPQVKEDYKSTVRFVLRRVNTVTGVPYKDDKALLAWQFGNEMHTAPAAWLSEMAAYIKSIDANHLVAETVHIPGKPMTIDPNIDLVTRHLYTSYQGVGGEWPEAMRREMALLKDQRPMFIGEFGPYINHKNLTHDNVVEKTRSFLDYVENESGICGSLIWSMYFRHQEGGFYWHQIMTFPAVWSYHYPGFPSADAQREIGLMRIMREAGFKIQGLPVPPVPLPEAPHLLPIGKVPMFSWRGSVGATGYDIQRAEGADGPWVTIARNLSDADIAYRPLFSDTTAVSGLSYFYRVIARSSSGASKPSNVVGPIAVMRVCLADELQDFSRAHAKSAGLKLNNDYNALYAEYLFRAQGSTNDWITYQAPTAIESVKVVAFFDRDVTDLALQVSSNGNAFTTLKPERKERRLPSPPGGAAGAQRRTMIEYECAVPAGQRQLQVQWNGPAELDRVEIYHR